MTTISYIDEMRLLAAQGRIIALERQLRDRDETIALMKQAQRRAVRRLAARVGKK